MSASLFRSSANGNRSRKQDLAPGNENPVLSVDEHAADESWITARGSRQAKKSKQSPVRRFRNGGSIMTIKVVRDMKTPMRHDIHIGPHRIATDASKEGGGEASAPEPHDFYDAALGACKALTVLGYARRKGMPLENVDISVDRDATEERAGTYRLSVVLTLTGNLSDAQREDLLRVAAKCPIHKLMTTVTTEITTSLST
jgi:putative redox protein